MEQPQPIDPKDEPTRAETAQGVVWHEFLERTRRYHRLTKAKRNGRFAKGLDSKPEDFA